MISAACRDAETWTEKDMIYVVGVVKASKLIRLCMVYGLDYCASDECYSGLKSKIKDGVTAIPGIDFTETNELGHINKVDPLGITYMRIHGMWGIENPWRTFNYVYVKPEDKEFDFMCVIGEEKFKLFDNAILLENLAADASNTLAIKSVKVKNPDNPAQLKDARLITFFKEAAR